MGPRAGTKLRRWTAGACGALITAVASVAAGQPATTEPAPSHAPVTTVPLPPRAPATIAAAAAELDAIRTESLNTRWSLLSGVFYSGIGTAVVGGLMLIPDSYDQAGRVAGIQTLIFGGVNTVVGAVARAGISSEREQWESPTARAERRTAAGFRRHLDHALADERRESVGHGINLGLDLGYAAMGATAIFASQTGASHSDRWLAAGVALVAQATHLTIIDLVGLLESGRYYDELMGLRPVQPSLAVGPAGAGLQIGGAF